IILIALVLLLEMGNFYFGVKVLSGMRALVAGEDYWTKQQKEAYSTLQKYGVSRNEDDYNQIPKFLAIINADHNARVEMEKSHINYAYVHKEFAIGGVNPADIDDIIFIFTWFRPVYWVEKSVFYWSTGEADVNDFNAIAQKVHALIVNPIDTHNPLAQSKRDAQIQDLMNQSDALEIKTTQLENDFAEILGEGSRAIKIILLVEAGFFNILLGAISVLISIIIARITTQTERDKNDFMRIANHQLNTPLSIMRNAHEMVKDKSLTLRKGFDYSDIGLTRVVNVFEDIKTVLEFDGQTQYDIKPQDMQKAMQTALAYAQKTISTNKKDIKLILEKPNFKLPMVMADIKQLNNALYNLLDNAIYYTPKGTVTVSYDLIDNNKHLKVSIKDTGIGFTEEDKQRLGQKFYRSKKALLARPDGSGLGLYIARTTLEHQKGQLFFESEGTDKGSTFGFWLEVAKS
ncbi:MAG: sensor histidine kinase, partial [Candidatus Paceibacterales bacterium]